MSQRKTTQPARTKADPVTLGAKHVARVSVKRGITGALGANTLIGALVSAAALWFIRTR